MLLNVHVHRGHWHCEILTCNLHTAITSLCWQLSKMIISSHMTDAMEYPDNNILSERNILVCKLEPWPCYTTHSVISISSPRGFGNMILSCQNLTLYYFFNPTTKQWKQQLALVFNCLIKCMEQQSPLTFGLHLTYWHYYFHTFPLAQSKLSYEWK